MTQGSIGFVDDGAARHLDCWFQGWHFWVSRGGTSGSPFSAFLPGFIGDTKFAGTALILVTECRFKIFLFFMAKMIP